MAREPHCVVKYSRYLGTAIKLVLYILKQLFASVSVNSGRYLPRRSGSVNIHRYSPPLRRIIVKYPYSIFWSQHFCLNLTIFPVARTEYRIIMPNDQPITDKVQRLHNFQRALKDSGLTKNRSYDERGEFEQTEARVRSIRLPALPSPLRVGCD